jgi:hypothetical protein
VALAGIQVQLAAVEAGTVDNGAAVIFDTVVNDQSPNISYSAFTGDFTVTATGNYYVTWWVATDGAAAATTVTFAIELNGAGGVSASSPIVTGQLSGSALITVGAAPATIALVNTTGDTVNFAATPIQANIIIVEVSL